MIFAPVLPNLRDFARMIGPTVEKPKKNRSAKRGREPWLGEDHAVVINPSGAESSSHRSGRYSDAIHWPILLIF